MESGWHLLSTCCMPHTDQSILKDTEGEKGSCLTPQVFPGKYNKPT